MRPRDNPWQWVLPAEQRDPSAAALVLQLRSQRQQQQQLQMRMSQGQEGRPRNAPLANGRVSQVSPETGADLQLQKLVLAPRHADACMDCWMFHPRAACVMMLHAIRARYKLQCTHARSFQGCVAISLSPRTLSQSTDMQDGKNARSSAVQPVLAAPSGDLSDADVGRMFLVASPMLADPAGQPSGGRATWDVAGILPQVQTMEFDSSVSMRAISSLLCQVLIGIGTF